MTVAQKLDEPLWSPSLAPQDIDQHCGIEHNLHRNLTSFGCVKNHFLFLLLGLRESWHRRSLCCLNCRTHAAAPPSGSGCSSAFQTGTSLSRKFSSLRRCTSCRAVSRRNALRPRGPTNLSMSCNKSRGIRMCALCVPCICALYKCVYRTKATSL